MISTLHDGLIEADLPTFSKCKSDDSSIFDREILPIKLGESILATDILMPSFSPKPAAQSHSPEDLDFFSAFNFYDSAEEINTHTHHSILATNAYTNPDDLDFFAGYNFEREFPEAPRECIVKNIESDPDQLLSMFSLFGEDFGVDEPTNVIKFNNEDVWDIFPFANLNEAVDDEILGNPNEIVKVYEENQDKLGVFMENILVQAQNQNQNQNDEDELPFYFGFDGLLEEVVEAYRQPAPPRPAPVQRIHDQHEPLRIFELFGDIEIINREEFFREQLKFSPFYEEETFDPYYISCKICCFKLNDYFSLPCTHSFCVCCIKLYLESNVDTMKVLPEDLVCPECAVEIPETVVNKFTSFETYEKLVNSRYKVKSQLLCAQGKAVACPVPDCPGYAHLIPGEKITACSKCHCYGKRER